jgi:predicted peptidase
MLQINKNYKIKSGQTGIVLFLLTALVQYNIFANTGDASNCLLSGYLYKDTIPRDSLDKLLIPDYKSLQLMEWEKQYSSFQFKVSRKNGNILPFRFYQPILDQDKKYPLVVLMHGAGERGFDNRLQFLRLKSIPFWEKYPCFIIAPQCPPESTDGSKIDLTWVDTPFGAPSHLMKNTPTWPLQLTMDLLDSIIARNPVDTDRIYVTGLSMGGFATLELLQRRPDKFAAAIPISGGGDTTLANRLINIPLWVFHGSEDKVVLTQRSRDMVKCITNAGGNPKYTEYPGIGHDAWSKTYNNQEVWDWLFLQRKGQSHCIK